MDSYRRDFLGPGEEAARKTYELHLNCTRFKLFRRITLAGFQDSVYPSNTLIVIMKIRIMKSFPEIQVSLSA